MDCSHGRNFLLRFWFAIEHQAKDQNKLVVLLVGSCDYPTTKAMYGYRNGTDQRLLVFLRCTMHDSHDLSALLGTEKGPELRTTTFLSTLHAESCYRQALTDMEDSSMSYCKVWLYRDRTMMAVILPISNRLLCWASNDVSLEIPPATP